MTHSQPINRQELEKRIIEKARKDQAFKEKLLQSPTETIFKELGLQYPPNNLEFKVLEETPETLYLVLPLSQETLAMLADDDDPISDEALEKQVVRSQSRVIQKCSEHSIDQSP